MSQFNWYHKNVWVYYYYYDQQWNSSVRDADYESTV